MDFTIDTIVGNAIYLCGLPEMHFKNIYLENDLQLINVDVTYDED